MSTLRFRLHAAAGAAEDLTVAVERLVIAGWAGRDPAALQHHIDELAAVGVAPPSRTPLFYAASPDLLTHQTEVTMLGPHTSGEVEPLLLLTDAGPFVGLGSDHTDRAAEAWSVPHSKQLCAKPVGRDLWRFADVAAHWDALVLRSWISGDDGAWTLYQDGKVASLLRPDDLAARAGLTAGTAMLCGTLGAIGGIRSSAAFRMELHDPVLGRTIAHGYRVAALPVVT